MFTYISRPDTSVDVVTPQGWCCKTYNSLPRTVNVSPNSPCQQQILCIVKYPFLWYIFFMTPRIKMIVNFKHTLDRICQNEWAMFRPVSTGLDHALVVSIWVKSKKDNQCVTKPRRSVSKCRSFVSANSLRSKHNVYYHILRYSFDVYPPIAVPTFLLKRYVFI